MPENTLIGFEAALRAGARFLELDVQLSSDGVPVLYHDAEMARVSGVAGSMLDRSLEEIKNLSASYSDRFGARFRGNPIATLSELRDLIAGRPDVSVFVEIKSESLKRFGVEKTVNAVFSVLHRLKQRVVFISFESAAVRYAKQEHAVKIGWVLPAWTPENAAEATHLAPEFLLCDKRILPACDGDVWRGPWQWVVYVVDDPAQAVMLLRRGIRFVETDRVIDMLRHLRSAANAGNG